MRTKICWLLCVAASVMLTTASPSHAQEEQASAGSADAGQQLDRTRADLAAAQSATRQQAPRGTGAYSFDPTGNPQLYGVVPVTGNYAVTKQRLPFANPQSGIFSTGRYPGFDPELAKINNTANQAIMDLVKKIKEADSEELKLELKTEMKQVLDEQYDKYLDYHEAPLKQLEERLQKLRAEFESRKTAKEELVKLRLDTIWYDAIGLGWPDGQRSAAGFPAWRQPASPFGAADLYAPGPPLTTAPRPDVPALPDPSSGRQPDAAR